MTKSLGRCGLNDDNFRLSKFAHTNLVVYKEKKPNFQSSFCRPNVAEIILKFSQVKEASIVTRPGVSDSKDTEDWQMIEDILESPRPLMLSQSTNDETILSPENDGQRAVIRRIDDENTTTSDAALPVLEHLVTPTFARTVDHGVVDEEFNSLFSEDTLENEPGNPVIIYLLFRWTFSFCKIKSIYMCWK
jgi:hypothetical protein